MNTMNKIAERAVLVQLNFSIFQAQKADAQATESVNKQFTVEKGCGSYKKRIIVSKTLDDIWSLARDFRNDHQAMTLVWGEATGLLPSLMFEDYMQMARGYQNQWAPLVDRFCQEYPAEVENMKRNKLRGLWRAEDYPPQHEVRRRFGIHMHVMPVPDLAGFTGANKVLAGLVEVQDGLTQKLATVERSVVQEIMEHIEAVCLRFTERLKPESKTLSDKDATGIIEDLAYLLEVAPKFNLTDHEGIKALHKAVADGLSKVTAGDLQTETGKEKARKTAKAILAKMADYR